MDIYSSAGCNAQRGAKGLRATRNFEGAMSMEATNETGKNPAGAQSSAKGATLTDVLAAADNVIANVQNMTDEQLIEALENVDDDSVSRAILGC